MSMILDVLVLRCMASGKGQRYGGTIKPTSPEACGMPHLARSIRNAFFSVLVSLTNVGYLSSIVNVYRVHFFV